MFRMVQCMVYDNYDNIKKSVYLDLLYGCAPGIHVGPIALLNLRK